MSSDISMNNTKSCTNWKVVGKNLTQLCRPIHVDIKTIRENEVNLFQFRNYYRNNNNLKTQDLFKP